MTGPGRDLEREVVDRGTGPKRFESWWTRIDAVIGRGRHGASSGLRRGQRVSGRGPGGRKDGGGQGHRIVAPARGVGDLDRAAVERTAHRTIASPMPGPARARPLGGVTRTPREALEDALAVRRRDAGAGVGDVDDHVGRRRDARTSRDRRAEGGVPDRVLQEVGEICRSRSGSAGTVRSRGSTSTDEAELLAGLERRDGVGGVVEERLERRGR